MINATSMVWWLCSSDNKLAYQEKMCINAIEPILRRYKIFRKNFLANLVMYGRREQFYKVMPLAQIGPHL